MLPRLFSLLGGLQLRRDITEYGDFVHIFNTPIDEKFELLGIMANVFIVAPESISTLFEGTPGIWKDAQRFEPVLVQQMLALFIQIVKERRYSGSTASESVRRELSLFVSLRLAIQLVIRFGFRYTLSNNSILGSVRFTISKNSILCLVRFKPNFY